MKLLFDQNLSHRLARALEDLFPDSLHVWDYARQHGFVIVSKDADFHQRSFVFGAPPKVVWVRLGNCSTADVERLLRHRSRVIEAFGADEELAFLSLS